MYSGGDAPSNDPTAQEYALAETSAKAFNEYLRGKPAEMEYVKDTLGFSPIETNKAADMSAAGLAKRGELSTAAKGAASADIAQKMSPAVANPTRALTPTTAAAAAKMTSKVGSDINRDVTAQQAAVGKAYVEGSMGLATSANAAQAGLAADAVEKNITQAESNYVGNVSTMKSVAGMAGLLSEPIRKGQLTVSG